MISIIVASHGGLASALVKTSEMIAGKQDQVATVGLEPSDGVESLSVKFALAQKKLPQDADTLILADLWGGSPFNVAAGVVANDPKHTALIAGVNLPILLEAFMSRQSSLDELVRHIHEISDDSIRQFTIAPPTDNDLGDDL